MAHGMTTDELPIITTSERSLFKRCPQAWWWRYRDGLAVRGDSPDALWFGIGVHEALASWYLKGKKRGPHPAATFEKWINGEIREIRASLPVDSEWYDEPEYLGARELGIAMLEGYIDKYGKDSRWHVIAVERPFRVMVTRGGVPVARFWSTWDGVYRDEGDGLVYLMEHKTASQISTAYLELDDQGGSYFAVASQVLRHEGVLKKGEDIAGVMYNFLRKSMPDERPKNELGESLNQDGSVSKRQPVPAFVREMVERSPGEVRTQMERLANEAVVMNAVRKGTLPVIKSPRKDCIGCEFFTMCTLHERGGRAWMELARSTFNVQDPYHRYRKSAA
jgi:PD-(D/E)XK nuclease superfamily